MVVKNADNLMKGFATSLSIILSCALSSIFFHDLKLSVLFILGSTTVVASTIAFGYTPKSDEGRANSRTTTPPPACMTETAAAT